MVIKWAFFPEQVNPEIAFCFVLTVLTQVNLDIPSLRFPRDIFFLK